MKKFTVSSKQLAIGGGVLLLLALVFVIGQYQGKVSKQEKEIDVKVNIKDENGQTISYDPNPLLEKLNKGLTSWYFFSSSITTERCGPIGELYDLDAVRFMATVRAYKTKYGVDIRTHMNAVYRSCVSQSGKGDYFDLITQRIDNLDNLIK